MSINQDKKQKPKIISIQDLIHSLGLLDEDVLSWIKRDNPKIFLDHKGQAAVSKEFLEKYSKSEEYETAFKRPCCINAPQGHLCKVDAVASNSLALRRLPPILNSAFQV
jgi:hypothetical protein